jgi:hypothetical protein
LFERAEFLKAQRPLPHFNETQEERAEEASQVDYRQVCIDLVGRMLRDVDEALGTEDYTEFTTRFSPEEQHWRIDLASRLNRLAEDMLAEMAAIEGEPETELAGRHERLSAVVERFRSAA